MTFTNQEIDCMSHNRLRHECKKANLPATGRALSLRRRLRGWASANRQRGASTSPTVVVAAAASAATAASGSSATSSSSTASSTATGGSAPTVGGATAGMAALRVADPDSAEDGVARVARAVGPAFRARVNSSRMQRIAAPRVYRGGAVSILRSATGGASSASTASVTSVNSRVRVRDDTAEDNNAAAADSNTAASDDQDVQPPAAKRQKKSAADDLLCPITLELPFDPVTAEDGRVYERAAIEKHFSVQEATAGTNGVTAIIKSPMTNTEMGKRLYNAPQIKSLIETLIEQHVITGDLVAKWNKKVAAKKEKEDLLKKAEQGNMYAMVTVARNFRDGVEGFPKMEATAFGWFDKARIAGSVIGTSCVGYMLAYGLGVTKDKQKGSLYLGMAAGGGSNFAIYLLGQAFASGTLGFPVDKEEAKRLLKKCLSDTCTYKHMAEECKNEAKKKLDELEGNNNNNNNNADANNTAQAEQVVAQHLTDDSNTAGATNNATNSNDATLVVDIIANRTATITAAS